MRLIDLRGHRFGRLVVAACASSGESVKVKWLCRCDCGGETVTSATSLRRGYTKSCGCLQREIFARNSYSIRGLGRRHGQSRTLTYRSWANMLSRCRNKNDSSWANYGGRGIRVCRRWYRFENFLADMGHRPSRALSIERMNNDGNYRPGNCKWATRSEQQQNRRRRAKGAK